MEKWYLRNSLDVHLFWTVLQSPVNLTAKIQLGFIVWATLKGFSPPLLLQNQEGSLRRCFPPLISFYGLRHLLQWSVVQSVVLPPASQGQLHTLALADQQTKSQFLQCLNSPTGNRSPGQDLHAVGGICPPYTHTSPKNSEILLDASHRDFCHAWLLLGKSSNQDPQMLRIYGSARWLC